MVERRAQQVVHDPLHHGRVGADRAGLVGLQIKLPVIFVAERVVAARDLKACLLYTSRGAAFTDRVKFLPLNDTAAWANTNAAASFRRDPQAREKAIKAGYDIHTSAEVLQAFYLRRYAEVTP